jgi:hypothetical protein
MNISDLYTLHCCCLTKNLQKKKFRFSRILMILWFKWQGYVRRNVCVCVCVCVYPPPHTHTHTRLYNICTFILWKFRVDSSYFFKCSFERTGKLTYTIGSIVLKHQLCSLTEEWEGKNSFTLKRNCYSDQTLSLPSAELAGVSHPRFLRLHERWCFPSSG